MKRNSGFTLVEMVVVLAVVAILAAILTPTIAKNINDAKLARATNETQVIGAAIGSFFKDVGRWPTSDGTATWPDAVQLLYGPGTEAAESGDPESEFWLIGGTTTWTAFDTFANQLITNTPSLGVAYTTASTSELRWRGPYLTEIKSDPWGSYYSCNIWYTFNTTTNSVCVWSAGPDRTAQTDAIQNSSTFALNGDDIVFRIQ